MFTPKPLEERFWNKVNKNGTYCERLGSKCWLWMGHKTGGKYGGYGLILKNGKNISTHRLSWTLANGTIPESIKILHKCDNPPCCNPDHLYPGTDLENAQDRDIRGRNGHAKLTWEKVDKIRKMQDNGIPPKELSTIFGVTCADLSDIKNYKIWKGKTT